jgi:hypothetical protein
MARARTLSHPLEIDRRRLTTGTVGVDSHCATVFSERVPESVNRAVMYVQPYRRRMLSLPPGCLVRMYKGDIDRRRGTGWKIFSSRTPFQSLLAGSNQSPSAEDLTTDR